MAFDPITAHEDDWQWVDGVQDALHSSLQANGAASATALVKVARESIWQDDAAGQRLAAEAGIVRFVFWKLSDDSPDPKSGDSLRVDQANGVTDWVVRTVEELRLGSLFRVSTTKAAVNA